MRKGEAMPRSWTAPPKALDSEEKEGDSLRIFHLCSGKSPQSLCSSDATRNRTLGCH